MLLSINNLSGLYIHATDGDLGKIYDFHFDDQDWAIRYLVVDVSSWLPRRKVLISPVAIPAVTPDLRRFMTALTREQVRESPVWDSDKPISRQYEALFADYYKYPYYWGGPALWGFAPYPVSPAMRLALQSRPAEERGDLQTGIEQSHLRSTRAVSRFTVETVDGEIGTVHDFVFDERSWQIRYLVIDTGKWLPRRKVLISHPWIDSIDWAQLKVKVQVQRELISNAPNYDNPATITRDYEERLFANYGKPYDLKESR